MKHILALALLVLLLLNAGCTGPRLPATVEPDGAWVLSDKWYGFMGLALVIKSNEFKYWFYSDAQMREEPEYPIIGVVVVTAHELQLLPSRDQRSEWMYDTKWHLVTHKGRPCLLGDQDMRRFHETQKFEDDRLLYKVNGFDEKRPVMNRPRKWWQ